MEHIRAGDLGAKAEGKTNIREFNEVNETFNTMMTQIKDLKIESYEHEIETQKAELRYMQLQIRPHFFLNCLKSLYALAEAGKYDRIQKMILEISKHIRYIFTDTFADLTVTDNGGGFPEDVIAEINEPDSPLYAQNHVGINNVKKRLQLIYGDRALYAFFNRDMGERMGSVSEILIPIDLVMLHAAEDEPDGEEAFNG